ncbi:MAG: hypothetical protein IPK52_02840 [Chloroflexi bacterium]|nr:hypothetical protein [Chloroflexota bacterium]
MATKKKSSTSGQRLNREILERARQQARAIESGEAEELDDDAAEDAVQEPSAGAIRRAETVRASSSAERRVSTAKRLRERNEEARKKALTADEIAELLANPTKVVTEAELHAQYGFVLRDLRNMGMLAGASFLFLIVLAVLLPH